MCGLWLVGVVCGWWNVGFVVVMGDKAGVVVVPFGVRVSNVKHRTRRSGLPGLASGSAPRPLGSTRPKTRTTAPFWRCGKAERLGNLMVGSVDKTTFTATRWLNNNLEVTPLGHLQHTNTHPQQPTTNKNNKNNCSNTIFTISTITETPPTSRHTTTRDIIATKTNRIAGPTEPGAR